MLSQELRRPWALAVIFAVTLACAVLIYDRWRVQPYTWPGHPDGVPSTASDAALKHGLEHVNADGQSFESAIRMVRSLPPDADRALPSTSFCMPSDCDSPLDLSAESLQALKDLRALNRNALDAAFETADSIPFGPKPLVLYAQGYRSVYGPLSWSKLGGLLSHELTLCTAEGDIDGALRALDTRYRLAESLAHCPMSIDQFYRVNLLAGAHEDIPVLANRMRLDAAQWDSVMALSRGPELAQLVENIRASMEVNAAIALRHYLEPSLIHNPTRIPDPQWHPASDVPVSRFTTELAANAAFAVFGLERLDQNAIARFTRGNRAHFDPFGELRYSIDTHNELYRALSGLSEVSTWYRSIQRRLGACVLYPDLIRAAAAIDCHRQTHGAFPASLDELSAECIRAEAAGPEAVALLFNDPYGSGPFQYRATEHGVVVYSLGPNRYDDTLAHQQRREKELARRPKAAQASNQQSNYGDDIRFELLAGLPCDTGQTGGQLPADSAAMEN